MADERTKEERIRRNVLQKAQLDAGLEECVACGKPIVSGDLFFLVVAYEVSGRVYPRESYCEPCGRMRADL